MEERTALQRYVRRALISLRFERSVHMTQTGLFMTALSFTLFLAASRLFVLPHYEWIAGWIAGIAIVLTVVMLFLKTVRRGEAVWTLDHYVPDNLLLTALDERVKQSDFAKEIEKRAESAME